MKINYPFVFRDNGGPEDSEKNGHTISASFARFLLSLASDFYSFYSGDQKVILSDAEKQLIESGIRDLTVYTMPTQLVFSGSLAAITPCAPGTVVLLDIVPDVQVDDVITWDDSANRLYFSRGGLFQVMAHVSIHNSTAAGSFSHQLQMRRNGATYQARTEQRVNNTASILAGWFVEIGAGNYLDWRYVNNGATITAQLATLTGVQVVKHA